MKTNVMLEQNNSEEYKLYILKVDKMLKELNSLNIDVSSYRKLYNDILSYNDPNQALLDLKVLVSKLNIYNTYSSMIYSCDFIIECIKDSKNINYEKVDEYVNGILSILKTYKKHSNNINIAEEKVISDKVYNVLYELMKLELTINDDSKVYKIISNNELDRLIISDLVSKDLDRFDLNDSKNADISVEKKRINSYGFESDYCDINLIKTIISHDEGKYDSMFINRLQELSYELSKSNHDLEKDVMYTKTSYDKYKNYNFMRKDKNKKLISLILACSFHLGVFSTGAVIAKKLADCDLYRIEKEYYSEEYGSSKEVEEKNNWQYGGTPSDYVRIYEYDDWNTKGSRSYKTYDIKTPVYDNIEDYLNLDLTNYKYNSHSEDADYSTAHPERGAYKEVVKTSSKVIGETTGIGALIFLETINLLGFAWIFVGIQNARDWTIANKFYDAKDSLENFMKSNDKKSKEKLIDDLKLLENEINKNEELRNRIMNIYNKNKKLIDNNIKNSCDIINSVNDDSLSFAKRLLLLAERNMR